MIHKYCMHRGNMGSGVCTDMFSSVNSSVAMHKRGHHHNETQTQGDKRNSSKRKGDFCHICRAMISDSDNDTERREREECHSVLCVSTQTRHTNLFCSCVRLIHHFVLFSDFFTVIFFKSATQTHITYTHTHTHTHTHTLITVTTVFKTHI